MSACLVGALESHDEKESDCCCCGSAHGILDQRHADESIIRDGQPDYCEEGTCQKADKSTNRPGRSAKMLSNIDREVGDIGSRKDLSKRQSG